MNQICLPEIYVADGIGIVLICCVALSWKSLQKTKENKEILQMIFCTFFSCAADIISFSVDGKSGSFFRMLNYFSNIWLYIANPVMESLWVRTLCRHINGYISHFQNFLINTVMAICVILVIVNFMFPVLFNIDQNNVYTRETLYWFFNATAVFFMIDSLAIYGVGKFRGGVMKFFPVVQFIVPVILGILTQGFFYGISVIWPSVSICVTCLILSLQNQNLITDKLTGLFNRFYLDNLKDQLVGKKAITVMMLDMNGFKKINDTFGHSEGDKALVAMGEILSESVGNKGSAIRYAGDEFVVVINTDKEEIGKNVENAIYSNVKKYNDKAKNFYKLSVSIGSGIFDFNYNSLDYVLQVVDDKMYKNKKNFYHKSGIEYRRN